MTTARTLRRRWRNARNQPHPAPVPPFPIRHPGHGTIWISPRIKSYRMLRGRYDTPALRPIKDTPS